MLLFLCVVAAGAEVALALLRAVRASVVVVVSRRPSRVRRAGRIAAALLLRRRDARATARSHSARSRFGAGGRRAGDGVRWCAERARLSVRRAVVRTHPGAPAHLLPGCRRRRRPDRVDRQRARRPRDLRRRRR